MDRTTLLSLWLLSCLPFFAQAQTPENTLRATPPDNGNPPLVDDEAPRVEPERQRLKKEEINARITRAEQLAQDIRPQVTELLQQALLAATEIENQSARAIEWTEKKSKLKTVDEYKAKIERTPEQLRKETLDPHDLTDIERGPIEQLEQKIVDWTKLVADRRAQISESAAIPERRRIRTAEIPPLIAEQETAKAEAIAKIEELTGVGAPSELESARRVLLEQQIEQYTATLRALNAELAYYQATMNLIPLIKQDQEMRLKVREQALEELRQAVNERQRRDAEQRARQAQNQAQSQVISRIPVLKEIADYNQRLTEEKLRLLELDKLAADEAERDLKRTAELESDLKTVRQRIEASESLSQAGGQLLRDQRARLPSLTALNREIIERQSEQTEVQFRNYTVIDRRDELDDFDTAVAETLAKVPAPDRAEAELLLQSLLKNQQSYLDELTTGYENYSQELGVVIANKESLQRVTTEISDFIAERDLWIRSCQPLGMGSSGTAAAADAKSPLLRDIELAVDGALWTFDPRNWIAVGFDLRMSVIRRPLASLIFAIAIASLLFVQRRARFELLAIGEAAAKRSTIEFMPSIRAAWLTLIAALPWPLLLWSMGWLLDSPLVESEFTRSISVGCRFCGALLFLSEFLRQSYRNGGLADAHFDWPDACTAQARRYLRMVPFVLLPLVLWIVGLESQTIQPLWASSLGRVLFIVVMVLVSYALWRIFLNKGSPLLQIIRRGQNGLLMSLHRVWRPLLVALPIALAGLAAAGYYYTAQQLTLKLLETAALVAGLMLLGGLLQRWVLLSRRKLGREQARQKRAAAQAAAQAAVEAAKKAGESTPPLTELPDEPVDLSALTEQTHKLITTTLQFVGIIAVFVIWQDVVPALTRLDDQALPLFNADVDNPMTWGRLLRFFVAVAVTFAVVRDLPSVLELAVLQKLPIDQGARYAISALVRYALLAIGIVASAAAIGITTTSISWLVAALSVGLGFGLQEIFANFVSGVILLFERPIRVGDIITLGNTTGVVSRIRIRATTIVDWDRKEYIVPNKDLVTERLLNWTLTDQTNRIVIEVGVAYGSDTDLAIRLLREICSDHPIVLADPAPLTTFEGFGDSTLNLVLRCYLPTLEHRLQTIHELHTAIDKKFRQHNIEIAFPQQDLHVRSVPEGWLRPNDQTNNTHSESVADN